MLVGVCVHICACRPIKSYTSEEVIINSQDNSSSLTIRASATKVTGPDAERFSCYPRVCLAWWWDRLHCGNYHIAFQTGRYRESDRVVLMGNAYIWEERSMDKWPITKCRMLHNNLLQIHTSWSWKCQLTAMKSQIYSHPFLCSYSSPEWKKIHIRWAVINNDR